MRKHNEVAQSKGSMKFTGVHNVKATATKSSSKKSVRKEIPPAKLKSAQTQIEDEQLLRKSQNVLQAKSKFYDRMMASGGSLNSDDTCLVMFSEKKATNSEPAAIVEDFEDNRSVPSSSSDESDYQYGDDGDDDDLPENERWVEYTDCLGRTRKCLKKDLEFFKKKDQDLSRDTASKVEEEDDSAEEPEVEREVRDFVVQSIRI